jgi:hypothetical protein
VRYGGASWFAEIEFPTYEISLGVGSSMITIRLYFRLNVKILAPLHLVAAKAIHIDA